MQNQNEQIVREFLIKGRFWKLGEALLTQKQFDARHAELIKKPKYVLEIETDSCNVDEFVKELIAYTFGILDEVHENEKYARSYVKAFWNQAEGAGINSYEDYKNHNIPEKESLMYNAVVFQANMTSNECSLSFLKKIMENTAEILGKATEDQYAAFYNNTLCNTYQAVYSPSDRWEQYTFYNTKASVIHGPKDTVCIQLNEPIGELSLKKITQKIFDFCQNGVYDTIRRYDCVSKGDISGIDELERKNIQVLSITLINISENEHTSLYTFHDKN